MIRDAIAGYFVHPETKKVVIVVRRKEEEVSAARARAALEHNLPTGAITDALPPTGEGRLELVVDLPSSATPPSLPATVGDYERRVAPARTIPQEQKVPDGAGPPSVPDYTTLLKAKA